MESDEACLGTRREGERASVRWEIRSPPHSGAGLDIIRDIAFHLPKSCKKVAVYLGIQAECLGAITVVSRVALWQTSKDSDPGTPQFNFGSRRGYLHSGKGEIWKDCRSIGNGRLDWSLFIHTACTLFEVSTTQNSFKIPHVAVKRAGVLSRYSLTVRRDTYFTLFYESRSTPIAHASVPFPGRSHPHALPYSL